MTEIRAIQASLRAAGMDGWLFCDHHRRDPIAARILGLQKNGMATRRWFYFIPAKGEPRKLVHRIEAGALDSLPGRKLVYSGWQELHKGLDKLLGAGETIAMQYSPKNNIPYIGLVDAGTIELVRKLGKKVVTSADLVQQFEAAWTPAQLDSHFEAGKVIDRVTQEAFARAGEFVQSGRALSEYDLQQWMIARMNAGSVVTAEPPIVAVQPNNASPHYEPSAQASHPIRAGDLLLLDIWGKVDRPESVYYDITWVGYLGAPVPEPYAEVFEAVRQARDRAVRFVQENTKAGRTIRGWQVDAAARDVIRRAGYGKFFVHRTGHSIGEEVHGNGANMDGLETHDDRQIIPRTCFSVEPGIYLPEFGIRSEVNVYVDEGQAIVTGAIQDEIVRIPVSGHSSSAGTAKAIGRGWMGGRDADGRAAIGEVEEDEASVTRAWAKAEEEAGAQSSLFTLLVVVGAWFVPGLGHWLLRRRARAAAMFAVVSALAVTGYLLRGNVFQYQQGDLFGTLGFFADASSGVLYFLARVVEKAGPDVSRAAGDYGTRFIVSAGVANLLCVLDALGIAAHRGERGA